MLVVYLDRYHLGDSLFLQRFAPIVRAHAGPLVLVHGSGEAAERALEAEGLAVERVSGVIHTEGERERALVERASRDLNRQIVHALNEAGVAAVRLTGMDRGLLRRRPDGALVAGRTDWLSRLAQQGAVPVVAALVEGEGGRAEEAAPGDAVAVLAQALEEEGASPSAVFFATGQGDPAGVDLADLSGLLSEPEAALWAVRCGVRVRVARPDALRGAGLPAGVDLPHTTS